MTPTDGAAPIDDQPPPEPNDSTPVWEMVVADMQDRDDVGRKRYGTPLQTFNGRDALVDAYQEGLDLVVYLRQAIEEDRVRERVSAAALAAGIDLAMVDRVAVAFLAREGGRMSSTNAELWDHTRSLRLADYQDVYVNDLRAYALAAVNAMDLPDARTLLGKVLDGVESPA